MKKIILLDQDCRHYRISIYYEFRIKLKKLGFDFIVAYDERLNNVSEFWITGIPYTYKGITSFITKQQPIIIIQFIWLKYLFLFPLMLYCRLRGIKNIVWTHGINLKRKNQLLKNNLYYLQHILSDAVIIYSIEQKKYVAGNHKKLFVANNTLNFNDLPILKESKNSLKKKHGLINKFVILTVARLDVNNRKIQHLIDLSDLLGTEYEIVIIGPGVELDLSEIINLKANIRYLGAVYDQKIVCEYYKLADIFCMPGAIGLAINQAFYFRTPCIIEDVDHGPEAIYLKEGINGYYYREGDVENLAELIRPLKNDTFLYQNLSISAYKTIKQDGTLDKMFEGFKNAINYVSKR